MEKKFKSFSPKWNKPLQKCYCCRKATPSITLHRIIISSSVETRVCQAYSPTSVLNFCYKYFYCMDRVLNFITEMSGVSLLKLQCTSVVLKLKTSCELTCLYCLSECRLAPQSTIAKLYHGHLDIIGAGSGKPEFDQANQSSIIWSTVHGVGVRWHSSARSHVVMTWFSLMNILRYIINLHKFGSCEGWGSTFDRHVEDWQTMSDAIPFINRNMFQLFLGEQLTWLCVCLTTASSWAGCANLFANAWWLHYLTVIQRHVVGSYIRLCL